MNVTMILFSFRRTPGWLTVCYSYFYLNATHPAFFFFFFFFFFRGWDVLYGPLCFDAFSYASVFGRGCSVPLLKTHLNPSASSRPCTVATIENQNIPKNTTWFRIRSADATVPMPEPMGQIGASSTGLWFARREGAISPATCCMTNNLVVYVCIHTRVIMHIRIIVHAHART